MLQKILHEARILPSPLTPVSVFFLGWIGLVTTDEIAIACDKTNRWPFGESFAVVLGTVLVALGELRKPLRMMTLAGGKKECSEPQS